MRRGRLGYPGETMLVAGRPGGWWLTMFRLSHREAGGEWERIAWPDGGALLDQAWPLVVGFEMIRAECQVIAAERIRRSGAGTWRHRGSR